MLEERQTYTVEETAQIMGIGRNSAYEAIRRGEIPSLRLGRRLVVPKKALDSLLAQRSGQDREPHG
jgi:excisionase family DNA binding protein